MKLDKKLYVSELSEEKQKKIEGELLATLKGEGLEGAELLEGVCNGLDSRICDLADTIDIEKYLAVTLDKNIVDVIYYLQGEDRNGSYTVMILEYENGEIEKELIIEVCHNVLTDWIENNTDENDVKEIENLKMWIEKLKN